MRAWEREFDFNHDGKIDAVERMLEFDVVSEESSGEYSTHTDIFAEELSYAGLDPTELEYMDESERSEAIMDAGLDPGDFDIW